MGPNLRTATRVAATVGLGVLAACGPYREAATTAPPTTAATTTASTRAARPPTTTPPCSATAGAGPLYYFPSGRAGLLSPCPVPVPPCRPADSTVAATRVVVRLHGGAYEPGPCVEGPAG